MSNISATMPNDFEALAKSAAKPGGKEPLQISAKKLMENFVWAGLDVDASWLETQAGTNGHRKRRLKLPPIPGTGTYVLGAVDGALQWLETEDCE